MRVESLLSEGKGPWSGLSFRSIDIEVCHRDDHRRLCIPEFEIPAGWSDQAGTYLAVNYARREGVPAATKQIAEEGVPEWLLRSEPDYDALAQMDEAARYSHESSVRQIVHRIVGAWTYWGWTHGYFDTEADAKHFYQEWCFLIATQQAMPASTQWAQTGLHWAYGTDKPSQNHYYVDATSGDLQRSHGAYERPLHHHCFIYGVEDDLAGEGGIANLWQREMRVFQRGSGAGCNLSSLRSAGERLSGGQEAGGLIPFIEAGEQAAATIRLPNSQPAQKLTLIEADHPDLMPLLRHKQQSPHHPQADVMSRIGVRLPDACLQAAQEGGDWPLNYRSESLDARQVSAEAYLDDIVSWQHDAKGGLVQFADTISHWHGFRRHDVIRASSPDGAFMFFNDSACDVVTINAAAYVDDEGQLDIRAFEHTARLMMLMSDISVTMAHYPTQEIAYNSYRYRPVGLSMCNLSLMLLRMGYAYDSAEGRAIVAACGALLTGQGYKVSAEIACEFGSFEAFSEHRDDMLRILWQHHEAAFGRTHARAGGVQIPALDHGSLPDSALGEAVQRIWDTAMISGDEFGYSNAQISLIATGANVAILMDQVAQGVTPLPAFITRPSAAGYMPLRDSLAQGLERLGYATSQREAILLHVYGNGELNHAPYINLAVLQAKGFTARECQLLCEALPDVTSLREAFDPLLFGDAFCRDVLHLSDTQRHDAGFDLPGYLGFSPEEVAEADAYIFGHATLAGAPFLRAEDMQVFAGQAEVSVAAQLGMMAGLQSFLSGGIAHHISLPREMTHAQQRDMLYAAWLCGLKQVCMYCPQPVAQPVSLPEATSHLVTVALLPRETQMAQPLMMQQPKTYAAREVIHLEPVSVMQDDPSMQASVDALADLIERHHDLLQTQQAEAKQEAAPSAPAMTQPGMHRPLPQRCRGYRQEVMIGDVVMHLQTGEYEDGTLGDIQVTLQNAAPDVQQQLQLLLNAVITGLQHGVPLEVYVQQFRGTRYAPSGMVQGNAQIPMASSLIDYLMQELAISYAQAKPRVSSSVVNEEMPVEQGAQDDAATLLAYTSLA